MKYSTEKLSNNFFVSVILFVFTFLFILFCIAVSGKGNINSPDITQCNFSGLYVINSSDNRFQQSFKIPDNKKINLNNAEVNNIMFIIKFNKEIKSGQQINLFMNNVTADIYKNGNKIFSYGYEKNYPDIVQSAGKEWIGFISPGITESDTIAIKLKGCNSKIHTSYINKFLDNIIQGNEYDLLTTQLEKNTITLISSILVFIMGFVLIVVMFTLKIMKSPVQIGDLSCGLLMISGSISLFMNYDYITLIFRNAFLVNIFDFLNHIFLIYFLLVYLRLYIKGNAIKKAMQTFINIWVFVILTFFILQITGVLDYINFENCISLSSILIVLFTMLFLCIDYNKLTTPHSRIIISTGIILTISLLIELLGKSATGYYLGYIFNIGLIIFSFTQFLVIMIIAKRSIVQASKADIMENELLQSKISVMLSQIQPHFLYNTLVVIRQLCDINPKIAKEAITEFASYLRGNLDSLTLNTTISFEKEMEHVENYISLEKKRFGDKINIEYDIEATEFEVPSLTIQTVVENAIRHGITKRKEGGTVTIKTYELLDSFTVEIRDNGVGVDLTRPPEHNDNRSHVGIDNAKKRIESMCNGTLIMNSTPSIGTLVLMTIPKNTQHNETKS
ncbi:MAG: histidine kinase [Acutalibacteraceae bacterium]|nr:histidine kinase [Acutalibacteraceae bacterium]